MGGREVAGSEVMLTANTSLPLYEQMTSAPACTFIADDTDGVLRAMRSARCLNAGSAARWAPPGSPSTFAHIHPR
jgi:hypothetical protein